MKHALLALALVACARHEDPTAKLDQNGRMMLESYRDVALRTPYTVSRLALAPDAVVADIGAGPGYFTLPFARAVPSGKVLATDVNATYLDVAAARARDAGLGNVETRVVRPDDPGLAPSSVDLAFLCQVDQFLPDRAAFFRRLVPSLRRHGTSTGRVALVNFARFRDADLAAAKAAGLDVVDAWSPTPPFFVLVLAPHGGP